MREIQYRITFQGVDTVETEVITVRARSINSGFGKALKRALEPLGSGRQREIASIEFWMVTS